jgi:hypothetical protein
MGWASLSVAMAYIHTSDERVLEFFSGHKIGHIDRKLIEESLPSEYIW